MNNSIRKRYRLLAVLLSALTISMVFTDSFFAMLVFISAGTCWVVVVCDTLPGYQMVE